MRLTPTSTLIRPSLFAAALMTLAGCAAQDSAEIAQVTAPRNRFFVMPYAEARPDALPPAAGRLCLLSTARCTEAFPGPATPCLLGTERCPRDGKIERLDDDGRLVLRR